MTKIRKICERSGCENVQKARGLCNKHYDRERGAPPRAHRHREDRILATRARNRAVARLVKLHADEFQALYAQTIVEVVAEDVELRRVAEAMGAEPTDGGGGAFRASASGSQPGLRRAVVGLVVVDVGDRVAAAATLALRDRGGTYGPAGRRSPELVEVPGAEAHRVDYSLAVVTNPVGFEFRSSDAELRVPDGDVPTDAVGLYDDADQLLVWRETFAPPGGTVVVKDWLMRFDIIPGSRL